jgi:predicted N-acyltransferase
MSLQARFHAALDEIDAQSWNALLPDDNPFVAHSFLAGLESSGSLRADYGWRAQHLALYRGDELVAAMPLYLKRNSHGEFVFDWSWASAYERAGLEYYPKLLAAIPYSPVTGARMLVGHGGDAPNLRAQLIKADADALRQAGWLSRYDWQFHWRNRGWPDFEAFLAALTHKKRKNIRHERAQVARAGVTCELRHGDELDEADWRAVHRLYLQTFAERGNHPALTEAFFRHLGRTMPRRVVAVLCRREERIVAMAFMLRSSTTLYGRYWGCLENIAGLHFEACYYQGIEYCLRNGLKVFEPGAQGEHKIARGFLPTMTHSFHYIRDARFRAAVADALQREAEGLLDYREELLEHSPYVTNSPVQQRS